MISRTHRTAIHIQSGKEMLPINSWKTSTDVQIRDAYVRDTNLRVGPPTPLIVDAPLRIPRIITANAEVSVRPILHFEYEEIMKSSFTCCIVRFEAAKTASQTSL